MVIFREYVIEKWKARENKKTHYSPCNKYFLSSYDVPGTVPGAKERLTK